jgi:hypothetical protein
MTAAQVREQIALFSHSEIKQCGERRLYMLLQYE